VSQYQKGKTNPDFTEARDSELQWHQLGHMQVCTLLQTDNHASTLPLSFLQAGCPFCHPTNSVKALKAICLRYITTENQNYIYYQGHCTDYEHRCAVSKNDVKIDPITDLIQFFSGRRV